MKAICRDELFSISRLSTRYLTRICIDVSNPSFVRATRRMILYKVYMRLCWCFVLTHNHAGDEFFGRDHCFFTENKEDNCEWTDINIKFYHLRPCAPSLLCLSFSVSSLHSLIPYLLLSLIHSPSLTLSFPPLFSLSFSSSFPLSFYNFFIFSFTPSFSPLS